MTTIRELIIQEIMDRAAVIRTDTSPQAYQTDLGKNVFRVRPKIGPEETPCIVVWPQAEEVEHKSGMILNSMPVRVEGIMLFGDTNPSVLSERILGDLVKCFTDPTWDRRRLQPPPSPTPSPDPGPQYDPPYAETILYDGGGTDDYPDEGSLSVGVVARFVVRYWTQRGNPYEQ